MAVTKLMHMKESPGTPYRHLKNAIDYVLDVKHGGAKTEYGALVGGNCGTDPQTILDAFLETKREFGKPDGRQGYHFVISIPAGEADKQTVFLTAADFCERYLGDEYDHVFCVHTDKGHLHAHIIFNSVSRIDGTKYHYKKGDWEKYIQPVTDGICTERGLPPLTFTEEKAGVPYDVWLSKSGGRFSRMDILKADIDYAIQHSDDMEGYIRTIRAMGYRLGTYHSEKEERTGFVYIMDDPAHPEKPYRRRDGRLGGGYRREEIEVRVRTKDGPCTFKELSERMEKKAGGLYRSQEKILSATVKMRKPYLRLYQAVSYYRLPNPYALPAYKVRSDMLRLEKLAEECSYLNARPGQTEEGLIKRREAVKDELRQLRAGRKRLQRTRDMDGVTDADVRIAEYDGRIRALSQERRILDRILSDEPDAGIYYNPAEERYADRKALQGEEVMPADTTDKKDRAEERDKEADLSKIQFINPEI